jgi:hypothetical protein
MGFGTDVVQPLDYVVDVGAGGVASHDDDCRVVADWFGQAESLRCTATIAVPRVLAPR